MADWNQDKWKRQEPFPAPVARPGDYPIGSARSRAAARAMIQPLRTAEEQLMDRVLNTLSNEEIAALIAYATLLQDGKQHEPTPDQQGALQVLTERLEEIRTTGELTAPRHP